VRALLQCTPVDIGEIGSEIELADVIAEERGIDCFKPVIRELEAQSARARGDGPGYIEHARDALRLYREIGAHGHAARLAAELELPA
jgi:hypothetical protein